MTYLILTNDNAAGEIRERVQSGLNFNKLACETGICADRIREGLTAPNFSLNELTILGRVINRFDKENKQSDFIDNWP